MKLSRRNFFKKGAAAIIALSLASSSSKKFRKPKIAKSSTSLNILILGGTAFTGPHQIKYALDRGHNVSIFNDIFLLNLPHNSLYNSNNKLPGVSILL